MSLLSEKADSHLPNKIRVNQIVNQMDEFYETYRIDETTQMYRTGRKDSCVGVRRNLLPHIDFKKNPLYNGVIEYSLKPTACLSMKNEQTLN